MRANAFAVDNFSKALAAVKDLRREGIISEYAIGGAMALIFWSEPTPTFDLDVFVLLPSAGNLVSLEGIYAWARKRGYSERAEHVVVAGVPVQFIPAHNALAEEAIAKAADLDYAAQSICVIRPEYLIAMYLEPSERTRKRMERVATLLDEGRLDRALLNDVLARYNLSLPKP
jgi:hypothetical protein